MTKESVAVVVVGDVGRSPRMQYHALSLANQANYEVDLVGLSGTTPCREVDESTNIRKRLITPIPVPWILDRIYPTRAIFKALVQALQFFWVLFWVIPAPKYILVQTPPAIPILLLAHIVCFLRRSRLVIDWHNYGYTWLATAKPNATLFIKIYKFYERFFGRGAYANFCVSKAMQKDLVENWGISARVLYDRAPEMFRESTAAEKKKLFSTYKFGQSTSGGKGNAFTSDTGSLKADRPALLVSSTSWTADENFDVLLEAVKLCDERAKKAKSPFPQIRLLVSGKGDLRSHYEAEMAKLDLQYFSLFTEFFPYEDYARALGSADMGICMHFSSSKLDLPMKVVDMFGAGLPVAALNYLALPELVDDGSNGVLFNTPQELANQIFELFQNFPADTSKLDAMRRKAREFQRVRWAQGWADTALPVFQR